jgi:hypothetical protein
MVLSASFAVRILSTNRFATSFLMSARVVSAIGPTTAKGYDHPGQYLQVQDVKPADNMYPVVQHPEQDAEARQKLEALEKRFGKKPYILIFLLDNVCYMDPSGFIGGGVAVGNSTPVRDKLAFGGLVLSSGYSTPSCSPSRATTMTGSSWLFDLSIDYK